MIRLIGPGGAGKTTAGAILAEALGCSFLDLDRAFAACHGDIGEFIAAQGYHEYARRNVQVYLDATRSACGGVMALSSGFISYQPDVHPAYVSTCQDITRSPLTFALLPSLDLEMCVAEIVRRQLTRSFSRTAAREEAVIRRRFGIYLALPVTKIVTMRPPHAIAADIRAWRRVDG